MRIGFTGTREGITAAQRGAFAALVVAPDEFHHGCCFGADEWAAIMVYDTSPFTRVIGHPSNIKSMTSEPALARCHEIHDPKPPLERNRAIVDACETLIACPKGMAEEQRSGTWATVRHARKRGKQILIVWPDGTVTDGKQ